MQAPPRYRSRPRAPARPEPDDQPFPELRPRRVITPLVPFALVLVLVGFAAVVAMALFPMFGAAGMAVNAFRERLDAAGIGEARIPTLPQSSTIYASDGKTILAEIYLDENRRYVPIRRIALVAQDAVVAIEDDSFYEHGALNFPSLVRAAIANLLAGEIEQGGSTLTQQLVKNVLIDSPEQTFARKFQEAALAIRIEREYSKRQILELYMNEAYYGNGAYGIETAAETYFQTTARKLTLPQAALLAGVIRAPGAYDPVTNPDAALARRNLVLDRMAELGFADPAAVEAAKASPLGIGEEVGVFEERVEPFFVYYIRNLILENVDGQFDAFGISREQRVRTLYQGGLDIYTTLDPNWQEYAQQAVDASPYIRHGKQSPDVALVSVRATDGAIKAMLSGKNYDRDQLDLVWRGTRQTGSAFKPFTLVAAFEQDFPQGKVYTSKSPLCNLDGWISASGCVSNAEGAGGGAYLDLWAATQNSVNVVFAQLALDVGAENIVEVAQRMGITVAMDAVPSITLGVEEVPVMDMAAAYATLANDGVRCRAFAVRRVEFANVAKDAPKSERVLYVHQPRCEQVIDPEIAHLVTAMLQRVVCCGTGRAAALVGRPVAGKTGTAQDYTNVYFAGYTPQVATAVWIGFPNGQIPMDTYYGSSVFGGTVAAPIWQDFMERAMRGFPVEFFESPPPSESGTIPDVLGLTIEEAEEILVEANFTPITEMVKSFEPEGTVVAQAPGGGGRARLGSGVKLSVSNGKGDPVVVPYLIGMSERQAVRALRALELIAAVEPVPVEDPFLHGIVVDQVPIGNGSKLVDVGATITIYVGELELGDGDEEPSPSPSPSPSPEPEAGAMPARGPRGRPPPAI